MDDWPREYEAFIRLFNLRDFFEAHEVLEDLWVIEVAPLKNYYKGLIQAAVALCHWQRGNLVGARSLYHLAEGYLSAYPDFYEGLELGHFREHLATLFVPLQAAPLPFPEDALLPILSVSPAGSTLGT